MKHRYEITALLTHAQIDILTGRNEDAITNLNQALHEIRMLMLEQRMAEGVVE